MARTWSRIRSILARWGVPGLVRRWASDRSGVALTEFAIIIPVLLIFLFGVMDVGRALWVRQTLQSGVDDLARLATVDAALSESALQARLTEMLTHRGVDDVQVTVTMEATPAGPVLVIEASTQQRLLQGLLPIEPIQLTSRVRAPRLS